MEENNNTPNRFDKLEDIDEVNQEVDPKDVKINIADKTSQLEEEKKAESPGNQFSNYENNFNFDSEKVLNSHEDDINLASEVNEVSLYQEEQKNNVSWTIPESMGEIERSVASSLPSMTRPRGGFRPSNLVNQRTVAPQYNFRSTNFGSGANFLSMRPPTTSSYGPLANRYESNRSSAFSNSNSNEGQQSLLWNRFTPQTRQAINEIEEYEISTDQIIEEAKMAAAEEIPIEQSNPNLIDHSGQLHQDFSIFLFNEQLSDLKLVVTKGLGAFDISLNSQKKEDLVEIPCHKLVLSARCRYFFTQFCNSEWGDKDQNLAKFTQFSEGPMREFLKYLYTGKLNFNISQIMGILRISSFFGMEDLTESCKAQLTNPSYLNAYDLCILYCEVREFAQDFDDMKSFLTELIPKRLESHMICSILKEIWVEKDEQDELQVVLIQKIQNSMNNILEDPVVSKDLFDLPKDAQKYLFSSSETCISEIKLFKAIDKRIKEIEDPTFLNELAKNYIRLSQLDVKQLVTEIKSSGIFDDDFIFKAIQFNVAPEVLDKNQIVNEPRFQPRGLYTFFDFKHFDLSIEVEDFPNEIVQNSQNCYLKIKRDKICQSTDDSCLSAIMSENLPLHGIHYWEFKIKAHGDKSDDIEIKKSIKDPKYLFVGLCQVNENHSMEDTHKSQCSVMLNLLDSSFWSNGQKIQNFQSKNAKIKNPFEDKDQTESQIIRVAVDLRFAENFQELWNQQQEDEEILGNRPQRPRPQQFRSFLPQNRPSETRSFNQSYINLQRRIQESMRDVTPNRHLNLFLNINNDHPSQGGLAGELSSLFFSSPTKLYYAVGDSEWSEGIDLNLINLKKAPLNLVISMPPEMERSPELLMSRAAYYTQWDNLPKEPYFLKQKQ